MAKVGKSLNGKEWDAAASKWDGALSEWDKNRAPIAPKNRFAAVSRYPSQQGLVARFTTGLVRPSRMGRYEFNILHSGARASWDRLSGWKKYRWALCAWRQGALERAPDAKWGDGGFQLYVRCWVEQATEAGAQPISPCSRRVNDPDASIWDYTP